jgi:DNA modification methylase
MTVDIRIGDCRQLLAAMPDESVHCVVTSPPYFGLRDYGIDSQIGLEPTPDAFVAEMVAVFREVRRVLRSDGVLWLNLGDSYANTGNANPTMHNSTLGKKPSDKSIHRPQPVKSIPDGLKPKDLIGIPWRVAFALQADGWYLRQDIIWSKPNPMPESVTDRCTKAHEYLFLLSKSARYWYDADAIAEPLAAPDNLTRTAVNGRGNGELAKSARFGSDESGRNRRSVWTVATQPFSDWAETFRRVRVAWDAPDDDKKCITSRDCPLHGDRLGLAPNAPCDEREAGQSSRSGHTDARPARERQADCAPIGTPLEAAIAERNSDSRGQSRVPSAIDRSNQSHRTDHDLETTLSCMPCDGTSRRTDDTLASPVISGSAVRTLESNTGQDEMDGHPSAETPSRNADNSSLAGSDCTCEWYIEKSEKTSHFATFPPDLIEPCIKAGCPKGGTVLDPFGGAGTTGLVADRLGRNAILLELNPTYAEMARRRISSDAGMFAEVAAQ